MKKVCLIAFLRTFPIILHRTWFFTFRGLDFKLHKASSSSRLTNTNEFSNEITILEKMENNAIFCKLHYHLSYIHVYSRTIHTKLTHLQSLSPQSYTSADIFGAFAYLTPVMRVPCRSTVRLCVNVPAIFSVIHKGRSAVCKDGVV